MLSFSAIHSSRTRGTTLIETVLAFFILAGGVAVLAALYGSTMSGQGKDVETLNTLRLAQSRIGELRALATDVAAFQSLESETGVETPSGFESYRVETLVEPVSVPYPCTGLQEGLNFGTSYKRVVVKTLNSGGDELVKLVSLIGEPATPIERLEVQLEAGPNPMPRDSVSVFRSRLIDTGGNEINDLLFRFYVDFSDGYGTLRELPDGQRTEFINSVASPTGPNFYTGGSIRIISRAFYAGQEYRGESSLVTLDP